MPNSSARKRDHRGQHGQADDQRRRPRVAAQTNGKNPPRRLWRRAGRVGSTRFRTSGTRRRIPFACTRRVPRRARIVLLLILLGTAALRRAGLTGQAAFFVCCMHCGAASPARPYQPEETMKNGSQHCCWQCRWRMPPIPRRSLAAMNRKAAYALGYRMGAGLQRDAADLCGNRQERHERRFPQAGAGTERRRRWSMRW